MFRTIDHLITGVAYEGTVAIPKSFNVAIALHLVADREAYGMRTASVSRNKRSQRAIRRPCQRPARPCTFALRGRAGDFDQNKAVGSTKSKHAGDILIQNGLVQLVPLWSHLGGHLAELHRLRAR